MNIEGVKNDSKATPLHQLPPPILSTNQDQPRLDGSSAVLDYNDILKDMDAPKRPPAVVQAHEDHIPEEYYEQDDIVQQPYYVDHDMDMTPYRQRPQKRRSSLKKKKKNTPLWSTYKYGIFVVALVAAALYFLVPRLGVWLPRTMGPDGKLNIMGIAIVAMAVGVGFEAGDRFVLSKILL
jgi:hypothetical protein